MPPAHRLSHDERLFFSQVHLAVLANPFSDRRVEIDRNISGLFPDSPRQDVLQATIDEVGSRLSLIEKDGRGDISRFQGEDRNMLLTACLFDVFHRFIDRFDELIAEQIRAGKNPAPVKFAKEFTESLKNRGFGDGEVLHFIALCYQLRRAFYFIDRGLVGRSPCVRTLRESLWNNVFTCDLSLYHQVLWSRMEDFSTLILGETGTGKGTAARAIGQSGFIPFDEKTGRFKESFLKTFLPLNISQFSENLIESELFGHRKGSFTGAVDEHKGLFDQCSPHGAIFLDEIGEVPLPVQIKLLKILEERVFSPVGSHDEHRFEGRIIAATNREFAELSGSNFFRRDFFYRLCSDIIVVPPLRERIREDAGELDDLLVHAVEKIVGRPSEDLVVMVNKEILGRLGRDYPWPGNVRELGQMVRRVLLKRTVQDRAWSAPASGGTGLPGLMDQGRMSAMDLVKTYCRMLYDRHGNLGEVARITLLDRRTVKKYIGVE